SQKLDEMRARADELTQELERARTEVEALSKVESVDEDYARLERALAERGRELTELRTEIERRGVLVRDLVEELAEARAGRAQAAPSGGPSGGPGGGGADGEQLTLRMSLESARKRAVDAEAAVVEA